MKKLLVVLAILAVLVTSAAVVSAQAATPQAQGQPYDCGMGFKASVNYGPDTGLTLDGQLGLNFDANGGVTGMYMSKDGKTQYPIAGQVTGRAINLAFNIGKNKFVYGVGTAWEDIMAGNCGTALGGPLVGPKVGDMGDWETICLPLGVGTIFEVKRVVVCTEINTDDD